MNHTQVQIPVITTTGRAVDSIIRKTFPQNHLANVWAFCGGGFFGGFALLTVRLVDSTLMDYHRVSRETNP
jgi:NAD(P)H-hydrate repair Nnr-like enzyme with NAD(P)H-hydrate epimerase domain